MKILAFEYVCGGGYLGRPIEWDILPEGYLMLHTLIEGLRAAGHHVTTLLDHRLTGLAEHLGADKTLVADGELEALLHQALEGCDAAYILAPELEDALPSLVSLVEESGLVSLNSKAETIRQVADKLALYQALRRLGVRTPRSLPLGPGDRAVLARVGDELGYPLVVKPRRGAGCMGLTLVPDKGRFGEVFQRSAQMGGELLAQEYIKGTPASVSLITDGTKARPLALNRQLLRLEGEPTYLGGITPYPHPQAEEALRLAVAVVEHLGLRGYVGVDLVLGEEGPWIVEVNPRLTVAYHGVSRVADGNPASVLVEAVVGRHLPEEVRLEGYAAYLKLPHPRAASLMANGALLYPPSGFKSDVTFASWRARELKEALALIRDVGITL